MLWLSHQGRCADAPEGEAITVRLDGLSSFVASRQFSGEMREKEKVRCWDDPAVFCEALLSIAEERALDEANTRAEAIRRMDEAASTRMIADFEMED